MISSIMLKDTLHSICSGLQMPTIIILLFLIMMTIVVLGSISVEFFTERRRLKISIPELMDKLQGKDCEKIKDEIKNSGLLKRQKAILIELTNHGNLPDATLNALACRLISEEELHYAKITTKTDLIARLGPMFGLMGTLIPLGPGLIALGQGDTKTLADSLLIAFDTTVAGLASSAVCFAVSRLRKNWYEDYLTSLEALMTCIMEEVTSGEDKFKKEPAEVFQNA